MAGETKAIAELREAARFWRGLAVIPVEDDGTESDYDAGYSAGLKAAVEKIEEVTGSLDSGDAQAISREAVERRFRNSGVPEAIEAALREETDLLDSEGNPMENFEWVASVAFHAALVAAFGKEPSDA